MRYKQRKDSGNPKSHGAKRSHICKHHGTSSVQKASSGIEGSSKVKTYIRKALHFGVESGYLIPDQSRKLLRVASDLMSRDQRQRVNIGCERSVHQDRERSLRRTPARFDEYEVQDARRRRRRRRRGRSRSGSRRRRRSRRRGRRRSRSNQPEEVGENEDDDYEIDNNDEKRNLRNENPERDQKNIRSNAQDDEKGAKREDDGSDMSLDEDETDEEDNKKPANNAKS